MHDSPPPRPTGVRRLGAAALLIGVVTGLYILPLAGAPPAANPNELVRIELALALAEWATVDLDPPAGIYGVSEDVARRDGRMLADKAPGLSLAAVPVVWLAAAGVVPAIPGTDLPRYWPLRHLLTAALVAVGSALLCFFVAGRVTGLDPGARLPLATLAAVVTPLWTYATVFFGHAPAAVLVAVAWLLLLRPMTDPGRAGERSALLGGLAAGLAIATEYPTVLLVAVIGVTLAARRTPARRLAVAAAGAVAGMLPALAYHQAAFGAPWLTGYAFKADPGFDRIHTTGLGGVALPTVDAAWGVLFGAARGLFYYSPILILAPVGLWLMHRRSGWRESAPLAAAILVYVGFAAGFVDWQAGWCAAARHLVPVVPLLVIPTMVAVAAAAAARSGWAIAAVTVLAAVSAIRGLLTLAVSPFFPPEFARPLSEIVVPSLRDGAAAPTVPGAVGIPDPLVWILAGLVVIGLVAWTLGSLAPARRRWVALSLCLALALQALVLARPRPAPAAGLELLRARWLVGLGHDRAAARIGASLDAGPAGRPGDP